MALATAVPAQALESFCATAAQAKEVETAYARSPGRTPYEIAKAMGVSEETVVTGLSEKVSIGTTDGRAFQKVWETLKEWERPTVALPLAADNFVEIIGPIGTNLSALGDEVRVSTEHSGLSGHFHPSSIAAIHYVALPRNDGLTLHGAIFLGADGKSIISVYSLKSSKPAVLQFLSTDGYQKTRNLIAALPRHCPSASPTQRNN